MICYKRSPAVENVGFTDHKHLLPNYCVSDDWVKRLEVDGFALGIHS